MIDTGGDPGLLAAVDQMIEQDTETPPGTGPEGTDDSGEVVGTMEGLDDHTLDPEIGPPHLLDQFGVVQALDQDPARLGHPGGDAVDGDRARSGHGRRLGLPGRGHQDDRLALVGEGPPVVVEEVLATLAIAQGDPVGREPHEMPDMAGGPVSEHEAATGRQRRPGGAAAAGLVHVERIAEDAGHARESNRREGKPGAAP